MQYCRLLCGFCFLPANSVGASWGYDSELPILCLFPDSAVHPRGREGLQGATGIAGISELRN